MVSFFRNPFHDTASGGRHDPLSSGQPPVMGAPFPVKAGDQAEPADPLFAQGAAAGDPLSGVVDEPTRLDPQQAAGPSSASLGLFDAPATGRVWLVGAHGGSGCTTICESAPDLFADAGRRLPVNPDVAPQVIVCAMSTARGLAAVQGLLREQAFGRWGNCRLLAVALTSPIRRLPERVVESRQLVCSVSPACFLLPYLDLVEVGFPKRWPKAYRQMRQAVEQMHHACGSDMSGVSIRSHALLG